MQAASSASTAWWSVFAASTTATAALNEMAIAGLEPRADPNPLATKFYLANTKDELVTSFKVITGVVSDCTFPLGEAPPVPENIGVHIDKLAPKDAIARRRMGLHRARQHDGQGLWMLGATKSRRAQPTRCKWCSASARANHQLNVGRVADYVAALVLAACGGSRRLLCRSRGARQRSDFLATTGELCAGTRRRWNRFDDRRGENG